MKQCQEIKQNWAGQKNFEICFCVIFDHYSTKFLFAEDWVLGSVSYHFCDIANIS